MTNIKLDNFLGSGTYADVFLVEIENTKIAIKCFKEDDDDDKYAIQEGLTLKQFQNIVNDCPGLIKYYGQQKLDVNFPQYKVNQNQNRTCLFLQACDTNLKQLKKFPQNEIFNFLSQISLSLVCLHSNKCSHNDLKPENILFDVNENKYIYYLADFGVTTFLEAKFETYLSEQSIKGTPFYFSPELKEIMKKQLQTGKKAKGYYNPLNTDIYALGLISLQLLIGKQFVEKLNNAAARDAYNNELEIIKKELLKQHDFQQNKDNGQLLNLILSMVSYDKNDRPQAIEICQKLIEAQQFSIDHLEKNQMKAVIFKLIQSFQPSKKKTIQEKLQQIEEVKIPTFHPIQQIEEVKIPTFESNIISHPIYSSIILSFFQNMNAQLERIHYQKIIQNKFDANKFHSDCDNKGPTLVIMHSQNEPNSLFGGMAEPSWNQESKMIADPQEGSWLFKLEFKKNKVDLHQWKCINEEKKAIIGWNNGLQFGGDFGFLGYGFGFGFAEGFLFDFLERARKSFEATFQRSSFEEAATAGEKNAAASQLPAKNNYYQKIDINKETSILAEIKKQLQINCPPQIFGQIMNEQKFIFELDALEVFLIKK